MRAECGAMPRGWYSADLSCKPTLSTSHAGRGGEGHGWDQTTVQGGNRPQRLCPNVFLEDGLCASTAAIQRDSGQSREHVAVKSWPNLFVGWQHVGLVLARFVLDSFPVRSSALGLSSPRSLSDRPGLERLLRLPRAPPPFVILVPTMHTNVLRAVGPSSGMV